MRWLKKLVSVTLVLCMLLNLCPAAFAAGPGPTEETLASEIDEPMKEENSNPPADPLPETPAESDPPVDPLPTESDLPPTESEPPVPTESDPPPSPSQEEPTASGTCGENLTWKLVGNTLTISGTGYMYNYSSPPWRSLSFRSVIIEDGVTSIGAAAFYNCTGLVDIVIPDGLKFIRDSAFYNCQRLRAIDIPDSVTSIGKSAFYNCSSMTGMVIPNGVTSIPECAFYGCWGLWKLANAVPDSVTSIGKEAFRGCRNLTDAVIPNSVTSIGEGAFRDCDNLANVVIPDSVTSIEKSVFSGCDSLTALTISSGVTSIGDQAFYSCDGLTEVVIPGTVTSIGENAFANCGNLTKVVIQDSVESIGRLAFYRCEKLTEIDIPDSVKSIGYGTFQFCSSLAEAVIPNGVTTISDSTFYDCSKLMKVVIPDSVTRIEKNAFFQCENLTGAVLPPHLTFIGESAFHWCRLTDVAIPDSVTYIGDSAFSYCTRMSSIVLSNRVTSIGVSTFTNCVSLHEIEIPGSVTSIKSNAFENCGLIKIVIPDSVKSIGRSAFAYCGILKSAVIPDSVTSIESDAFFNCKNLKSVELSDNLASIESSVFGHCTSLTDVVIPDSVTSIGSYAFQDCTSLTDLVIPDSVTSIGSSAFQDCTSLTDIIIPDSVTSIGSDVFKNTNKSFTILCYPDSYALTYAEKNSIPYRLIGRSSRTLSITVLAPDGAALTDGFTVAWYDRADVQTDEGRKLLGADEESAYSFEITLDTELSKLYKVPARQTILPADEAERTVRLEEIPMLTLTGRVLDKAGAPIVGAEVSVTAGSISEAAATDENGRFQVTAPCDLVQVTIRKDDYYVKRVSQDLTNKTDPAYDMGNCTLTEVIRDRVTLTITQTRAVEEGAQAVVTDLTSAETLCFTLTNGSGQSVMEYDVQGTSLLFRPGAVAANEKITISITDPSEQYVCVEPVTVTLDEDRTGNAALALVQKGGFVLRGLTGPEARVLIFDRAGNLIRTDTAQAGTPCAGMDGGDYTLVLLQKTSLLQGVPSLSYLDTIGLTKGEDYLLRAVSVENGRITCVEECAVPRLDEDALTYTVAEETGVTSSKPDGVAAGELILLRAFYEMDVSRGAQAERLQIVLPKGIQLVEDSVLLDKAATAYAYDSVTRTVSVDVSGRTGANVYLYCATTAGGTYNVGAFLTLGGGAVQPIGAAVIQVKNAELSVLTKVDDPRGLTAAGKTFPQSTVILYDNDAEVGRTTSNAVGSWSMQFDLAQPVYSHSYHFVHAVIENKSLSDPIVTEETMITYNKEPMGKLAKITMYNTGDHGPQETVFDFTSGSSTTAPHYRMWPSRYPTFTFKVEFSGDASQLSDVYVVTANSTGDKTYVKTAYDAESGAWVGMYKYTSFNSAPAQVGAAYSLTSDGELLIDEEMLADLEREFEELDDEIIAQMVPLCAEAFSMENVVQNENSVQADVIFTDPDTKESQKLGSFLTEMTYIDAGMTVEQLEASGYSLIDEDNQIWSDIGELDQSETQNIIDLKNGFRLSVSVQVEDAPQQARLMESGDADAELTLFKGGLVSIVGVSAGLILGGILVTAAVVSGVGIIGITAAAVAGNVIGNFGVGAISAKMDASVFKRKMECHVNGRVNDFVELMGKTNSMINAKCASDGSDRLSKESQAEFSDRLSAAWILLQTFQDESDACIEEAKSALMKKSIFLGSLSTLIDASVDSVAASFGASFDRAAMEEIDRKYLKNVEALKTLQADVKGAYLSCGSDRDDQEIGDLPADLTESAGKPGKMIADPSGFVYEAVPSNRLEGVTAVISCEAENGEAWNASDFDQVNPQVTGSDGSYYWDVPQGNWKVSFTKDGYRSADTSIVPQAENGWLPVPPPQLDINVGMISTAAPTVAQAEAYADRVEVTFSQYMDIDSVEGAVSLNGGTVTVTPLDAEYNLEGTVQYATRFALPTQALPNPVTVSVSTGAKNYAGTALAEEYQRELSAKVRPTGLSVPDTVSVNLHAESQLAVVLEPGVASQTLRVESLTPGLVSIAEAEVTTDEEGAAVITLNGDLPGSGQIRITEPISGVSKTVTTNIGTIQEGPAAPAAVSAVLEDGTTVTGDTTVSYGTAVTLQTTTTGAVIRYTLDDTCPCQEGARVYSGPITITEDTVLRAVALKDGVYSTTIRFELTVKPAPAAVSAALADGTAVTAQMTVSYGAAVTLQTATPGAEIRYTLDGTSPCRADAPVYSGSLTLTKDAVLCAAALKDGVYSTTVRFELTVKPEEKPAPEAVSVTLADGTPVTAHMTVSYGTVVKLQTTMSGAEIRYTLDGTSPCRADAPVYSGSLTLTRDTVLCAVAVKDGVYSTMVRFELGVTDLPDGVTAVITSAGENFTIVTVTDPYNRLASDTQVIAARYENGRMVEVESSMLKAGQVSFGPNVSAGWMLFFLDRNGLRPLCGKIELTDTAR